MSDPTRRLRLAALPILWLAAPAQAQIPIGETGFTITGTATYGSDYVSRGLSQTRSRMAYQVTAELQHESGLYLGGFIGNVRFAYTDARQEVDVFAGYRFSWSGVDFDIGGIGTFYPGYSAGRASDAVDFGEAYLRLARQWGPVRLMGSINVSPNYFDATGLGVYLESGADWTTGFWGLTLGARLGYQFIEKNPRFGTPDYTWWGIALSRDFEIENLGTITASLGYFDTSIHRPGCLSGQGVQQDTCAARVIGSIAFKF
ncbi:TorF family putative porin [Sediminicoccus sp. KRV36]|uniref:TorF family putative porin n=1 Tax=Sediminicoccus sp. KRV36 TaxID=3133721 RepID=UPI00200D226D|nr:TorF family putative porin [Sediminicoccus rosea]UPY35568.1 TorF family putative porin [Sediminicoccus rosea]